MAVTKTRSWTCRPWGSTLAPMQIAFCCLQHDATLTVRELTRSNLRLGEPLQRHRVSTSRLKSYRPTMLKPLHYPHGGCRPHRLLSTATRRLLRLTSTPSQHSPMPTPRLLLVTCSISLNFRSSLHHDGSPGTASILLLTIGAASCKPCSTLKFRGPSREHSMESVLMPPCTASVQQ